MNTQKMENKSGIHLDLNPSFEAHEIDASVIFQVCHVKFGFVIRPELFTAWARVDRTERYAFAALGPFELFLDW